jgi:hypothetical protein
MGSRNLPCVLDGQTKIMLDCEFYGGLNVTDGASINANDRDTSLLAGYAQCSVHVTRADGPVVEDEGLKIGKLHGSRLVRTPVTIELVGLCVCAVSRRVGKWVTC